MAQQTPSPPPQNGVPANRSRGPVVLVVVLAVVLIAVLATGLVLFLRSDDKPATTAAKPAAADALQFRPVLSIEPKACDGPSNGPRAENIRCSHDGTRYTLGPVELDGSHVSEVKATAGQPGPLWVVQVTLDQTGAQQFAELTGKVAVKRAPMNQLAIVVRDQVVAAPTVNGAITGGELQIAGDYSEDDARKLAADITG